jgi:hypothetical protein
MDDGESDGRRAASLVGWLIHPVTLLGIVVLAVNDHLLKAHYPGLLTGKLSDLAGLVVAPPLLALALVPVVPRRSPVLAARAALTLTAACFTAVKASAAGAQAASAVWEVVSGPSVVLADRTDLVALPAVGLAGWAWRRARRRPPSTATLRRIGVLVVLPAAAAAVAGTTAPYSPEAVAVGAWRGMIVAGQANVFDRDRQPEVWRLSADGRVWRWMTPAEESAFQKERLDQDFRAGQSCVPGNSGRCYRIVPGHLMVLESADGGATWSTSWQVPDGRRTYLARQHRDLRPGDVVAHLSAQAVAVLPVADDGHLVVVANGPDGFAVRDASGRWERVGFGTSPSGFVQPATPLNGEVSVIAPEVVLAVLVGLLVVAVAGWRISVAVGRGVTGPSVVLIAGLLVGLCGAAGRASWLENPLDLAVGPAAALGMVLTLIGVGVLIWPGLRARTGRRALSLVLIAALGTAGGIIATFWAWMDGLLVDYRAATIMALVVALAGTSLGGRLAGRAAPVDRPPRMLRPARPRADPAPAPQVAPPAPELAGPSPPAAQSRLRPAQPPAGSSGT